MQEYCANCSTFLSVTIRSIYGTADSMLYNPKGPDIELCMHCSEEEEKLVEITGHNEHPEVVKQYLTNMRNNRDL